MKVAEVARLSPEERLIYWVRERHAIYTRRQAGKQKPWTNDDILLDYKFCNPRRMNDRVSQWLLEHWFGPFRDHPNMVLACTLARQLNNTEALAAVGFPEVWQPERVEAVLDDRAARGLKNYSAAYMITSNYGTRGRAPQTKQHQTVWIVCDPVARSGLRADAASMERTWRSLLGFKGFSSFIAGQVTADLRWALTGTWADRLTWAPKGPGSERGLNRLLGRPRGTPLTQDQFAREMRAVRTVVLRAGVPGLEMMDCQSCLCEFDKYERVLRGEGRTKCRYDGRSEP